MRKIANLFIIASIFFLFFPTLSKTLAQNTNPCLADSVTFGPAPDFNATLSLVPGKGALTAKHRIVLEKDKKIIDGIVKNADVVAFELGRMIPGDYPFAYYINFGNGYGILKCDDQKRVLRIPDVGQGGKITTEGNLQINPPNPTLNDRIHAIIKNLTKDSTYAIFLSKQNSNLYSEDNYRLFCVESTNKQLDADIGTYKDGAWFLTVSEKDPNSGSICRISDIIIAKGGFTISSPTVIFPTKTPSSPCATLAPDGKCLNVNTAIGLISTEPQEFVKSIFGIVLGLAGGIALVLIILSGYKMMASQGNPEALTAARGQLISTVIGLLFIILSFVILQVIGVDILKIPGFGE